MGDVLEHNSCLSRLTHPSIVSMGDTINHLQNHPYRPVMSLPTQLHRGAVQCTGHPIGVYVGHRFRVIVSSSDCLIFGSFVCQVLVPQVSHNNKTTDFLVLN